MSNNDDTRRVPLTKGKFAIVDAEDFDALVAVGGWYFANVGYAVRLIRGSNPKKFEYMHRRINGTPAAMVTDHINGDKLDNRKANLRTVTNGQNMRNAPKRRDNTSGFKGVGFFPQTNRWRAVINFDGKYKHLGFFATKEQARDAYDAFVKEHYADISQRHLHTHHVNHQ